MTSKCEHLKVNQEILAIFKNQHDGQNRKIHWHVGDNDTENRNRIRDHKLYTDNLLKLPTSKMLYDLLMNEFSASNYVLGSILLNNNKIDPCVKMFPMEDLDSNYLIIKTHSNAIFVPTNITLSAFFPSIGYALSIIGTSELIQYKQRLSNTKAEENIYLIKPKKITIGYYNFYKYKIIYSEKKLDD